MEKRRIILKIIIKTLLAFSIIFTAKSLINYNWYNLSIVPPTDKFISIIGGAIIIYSPLIMFSINGLLLIVIFSLIYMIVINIFEYKKEMKIKDEEYQEKRSNKDIWKISIKISITVFLLFISERLINYISHYIYYDFDAIPTVEFIPIAGGYVQIYYPWRIFFLNELLIIMFVSLANMIVINIYEYIKDVKISFKDKIFSIGLVNIIVLILLLFYYAIK